MRQFETGATRDSDANKFDYEGFESPRVTHAFAAYMHKHRTQADGKLRDSDNWQKGIPKDAYMKSMWRHFFDVWCHHRGLPELASESLAEALGALRFNLNGYWFETLKDEAKVAAVKDLMEKAKDDLHEQMAKIGAEPALFENGIDERGFIRPCVGVDPAPFMPSAATGDVTHEEAALDPTRLNKYILKEAVAGGFVPSRETRDFIPMSAADIARLEKARTPADVAAIFAEARHRYESGVQGHGESLL